MFPVKFLCHVFIFMVSSDIIVKLSGIEVISSTRLFADVEGPCMFE
jgi:hypothetical protein